MHNNIKCMLDLSWKSNVVERLLKMNSFLNEHPTIVPLFEVDVLSAVEPYVATDIKHEAPYELDPASIKELQQARDALERELEISQRVKASILEDVNLDSSKSVKTWPLATDRP